MEFVIPYLLIILAAPVTGQADRQVDEVRVMVSLEQCETLRMAMRQEQGSQGTEREILCVPIPPHEEFERAYRDAL